MNKIKFMLIAMFLLAANMLPIQMVAQLSRPRNTYSATSYLKDYSSNSASSFRGDPGGNPDVPIDGGISLLILAGAALGAKKMHAKRKESKDQQTI